jgi:O-succinylhomoserine sulfhydrylase
MLKGLETIDLRVRAQTATAQTLAAALEADATLHNVIYPGLASHPQNALVLTQMGEGGTVLSIDAGTQEAAFKLLNSLKIWTISNNLGDAKSIGTHPATTTHQRLSSETKAMLGITPGLIRLSVGLEDPQDLLEDLRGAIAQL